MSREHCEKGEIACYEQSHCFQKISSEDTYKPELVWERVKGWKNFWENYEMLVNSCVSISENFSLSEFCGYSVKEYSQLSLQQPYLFPAKNVVVTKMLVY